MRIGTRTLKVTAWLSGTMIALCVSCFLANVVGVGLAVEVGRLFVNITDGATAVSVVERGRLDYLLTGYASIAVQSSSVFSTYNKGWWLPYAEPWSIQVPHWIPAVVSLAIGTPAFVTLRRRARAIKNGACRHCGYALIGIAPAAPCPECGRVRT